MEAKFNTNTITIIALPLFLSIFECFSFYISCCLIEPLYRDLDVVHL